MTEHRGSDANNGRVGGVGGAAAVAAEKSSSWIGRRLYAPASGRFGTQPEQPGTVLTQREGRDERFTLGIQLDAGGFVFAQVNGKPPAAASPRDASRSGSVQGSGGEQITVQAQMIGPPQLDRREARDLALAVLNGQAARAPIENVERALAAAVLTFIPAATP